MTPSEVKPGTLVWYYPSPSSPRFAAVVDEEVWFLGETPVVRLRDLPLAYGEWRKSPRTTVPAAALFALEPRQADAAVDPVEERSDDRGTSGRPRA